MTLVAKGAFSIQYITPNSGVTGDYISDFFGIGSIQIENLTMAVATSAKYVGTGIMGIGFSADESIVVNGGQNPYPNIIDELVNQGLIKSRAYSIWLDGLGTLLPRIMHCDCVGLV